VNDDVQERRASLNRAIFFMSVVAILIIIQTPLPELLLSNFVSGSDSVRLTATVRTATPGILVALIVTFLYERSKDYAYKRDEERFINRVTRAVVDAVDREDDVRVRRFFDRSQPKDLLVAAMSYLYPEDTRLETIVDQISPDRKIERDVVIDVVVRDLGGFQDKYLVEHTFWTTFSDLSEYVLAVTSGLDPSKHLWRDCPSITRVYMFDSVSSAQRAIERALSDQSTIRFIVESNGALGALEHRSLERVPAEEYPDYNVAVPTEAERDVVLLRAHIPNGVGNKVRLIEKARGTVDRPCRFASVSMDRVAYIRRVSFDWSNLTIPSSDEHKTHLVPFFLPYNKLPSIAPDSKRIDLIIEQWLLPGAGVVMLWW